MSSSRSQAIERGARAAAWRARARRENPPRLSMLPEYDVRVRRELAHRRFAVSIFRQLLRLVSLHGLDALVVTLAALTAEQLSGAAIRPALPALITFILLGLNVRGSYRPADARRDAGRLVTGVLIGVTLASIPATLPTTVEDTPQFLILFGLASIALLIVERRMVDAIVHQAYARGIGLRRAVIVARSAEINDVLAGLHPQHGHRGADDQVVVGYLIPDSSHSHDSGALGSIADLEHVLVHQDVSELLVATSLRADTLAELAEVCFEHGVRVLVIPVEAQTPRGWAELTRVGRWPAYHLHPARLELPALLLKRLSDLVLASLALIVSAPLMLLIAIGIKLESPGPVFFRQRRVGLGGREFSMWKFRSMLHEAEARQDAIAHLNAYRDGKLFKLRLDPRVTRLGRILRRFSLDELPQLFNILAGDMSLVGPRPPLPGEVKQYEPQHYVRLSVVPGLTGPWQVNGRNLITDFEEVVRLEKEYIENWSLRSDLEIVFRTFGVVLSGKGAY